MFAPRRFITYFFLQCLVLWGGDAFADLFKPPEAYLTGGLRYKVEEVIWTGEISVIVRATREFDGSPVVLRIQGNEREFQLHSVLPNQRVLSLKAEGAGRAEQFLFPYHTGVGYRSDAPDVKNYIAVIEYSGWPTMEDIHGNIHPDFLFQGKDPSLEHTRANLQRIKAFVVEMVETVIYMAERGFVLGDIKPHNVMFKANDSNLQVRLFDFDSITDHGDRDNTAHTFMSAEDSIRIVTEGMNPMMDIYAIGVSVTRFFEAITLPPDHLEHEDIKVLYQDLALFAAIAQTKTSQQRWENLIEFDHRRQWFTRDAVEEHLAPQVGSFFQALWQLSRSLCVVARQTLLPLVLQ